MKITVPDKKRFFVIFIFALFILSPTQVPRPGFGQEKSPVAITEQTEGITDTQTKAIKQTVESADCPNNQFLRIPGNPECRQDKKIVLVSGDEEYRSEEMLTQLAWILSVWHGFDTVVLYAINPETGMIDPLTLTNIPDLEELRTADLMIFFTRFRNLPDSQMKEIDDYLRSGRPIIGIRTATHAFNIPDSSTYARYSFNYKSGDTNAYPTWNDGFGHKVLGETWIDHHGIHKTESTRGILTDAGKRSPILQGCSDLYGPTDVYRVRLPLQGDAVPLVLGQVLSGMAPNDPPVENEKNNPMMPIIWLKSYTLENGTPGQALTSTLGCGQDFLCEDYRRLLVNATYVLTGLTDLVPQKANVRLIGDYEPREMGFGNVVPNQTPAKMIPRL